MHSQQVSTLSRIAVSGFFRSFQSGKHISTKPPIIYDSIVEAPKTDMNPKNNIHYASDSTNKSFVSSSTVCSTPKICEKTETNGSSPTVLVKQIFGEYSALSKSNRIEILDIHDSKGLRKDTEFFNELFPKNNNIIYQPIFGYYDPIVKFLEMKKVEGFCCYFNGYTYKCDKKACLNDIAKMPENAIIVLHANRPSVKLTPEQWKAVSDAIKKQKIFVYFYLVYEKNYTFDEVKNDTEIVQFFVDEGHETAVSLSFVREFSESEYRQVFLNVLKEFSDIPKIEKISIELTHRLLLATFEYFQRFRIRKLSDFSTEDQAILQENIPKMFHNFDNGKTLKNLVWTVLEKDLFEYLKYRSAVQLLVDNFGQSLDENIVELIEGGMELVSREYYLECMFDDDVVDPYPTGPFPNYDGLPESHWWWENVEHYY